jgi:hypothetical protein
MKNNLKRYKDFIKESVNFSEERDRFSDVVREDLNDEMIVGARSYSDVCKKDGDPDKDFNEMQDFMDSKGFTIEKIKEIFSAPGGSIVDTYNQLDSISATVDVYFYKLFEKLGLDNRIVSLGGSGWCDWKIGELDEAFIRYSYGYHNTKYGQLMIKESGRTEEAFIQDAISYLEEYISDEFNTILSSVYRNKYDVSLYSDIRDWISQDDFMIQDDERFSIDIVGLCNELNTVFPEYKIKPDDLVSEFYKNLGELKIQVVFTGSDLIIYTEPINK